MSALVTGYDPNLHALDVRLLTCMRRVPRETDRSVLVPDCYRICFDPDSDKDVLYSHYEANKPRFYPFYFHPPTDGGKKGYAHHASTYVHTFRVSI